MNALDLWFEIAKRIEAGKNEVEEEVLRSPVTLDLVIEMGARIEAGEADLRDLFEENEEPADADEERGQEANEKPPLRQVGEETYHLPPPQLLSQHGLSCRIAAVKLEYVFCQIDRDSSNLHCGPSSLSLLSMVERTIVAL